MSSLYHAPPSIRLQLPGFKQSTFTMKIACPYICSFCSSTPSYKSLRVQRMNIYIALYWVLVLLVWLYFGQYNFPHNVVGLLRQQCRIHYIKQSHTHKSFLISSTYLGILLELLGKKLLLESLLYSLRCYIQSI